MRNRSNFKLLMNKGPSIPQSVDLALYGADATLTDQRAIDGFYLFANGASAVSRTVSSAVAFAGDVLAEFVYPGDVMPYTAPAFHNANKNTAFGDVGDATMKEGMVTEGFGGGNTYVMPYKNGAAYGGGAKVRNGNLYIELVGAAFRISTGLTFAGRAVIHEDLRVDAAARYFAMTNLVVAPALSKSVRIRVRAHPGG